MSEGHTLPRPLRWALGICVVIAVAVVVRRVIALAYPAHSGPPQLLALDALFASHAALTLVHILPALFFVCVSVAVFRYRGQNHGSKSCFSLWVGSSESLHT